MCKSDSPQVYCFDACVQTFAGKYRRHIPHTGFTFVRQLFHVHIPQTILRKLNPKTVMPVYSRQLLVALPLRKLYWLRHSFDTNCFRIPF